MKHPMRRIIIFLGVILAAAGVISCQEDPAPGGTRVQDMAGEWWVHYEVETSPGNYTEVGLGYVKLMTYNTASNTDSMWVNDLAHFWDFKVKTGANPATKTFAVTEQIETEHGAGVTIEQGQVLTGQGRSVSGVTTDSIHFVVSFSDDVPAYGNKYRVSGHRRTGFLEDELE